MWLSGVEFLGPLLTLVGPARSSRLCSLSPCLLQPKDLFIILHKYTVADFRRTRRGRQISLWVVVSHHVVAGIWTQDLWKSSQCSYPLSHLTSPRQKFKSAISLEFPETAISVGNWTHMGRVDHICNLSTWGIGQWDHRFETSLGYNSDTPSQTNKINEFT